MFGDSLGEQYGVHSWIDTPVKDKNGRDGKIIGDYRFQFVHCLRVLFADNEQHLIRLFTQDESLPEKFGVKWQYRPGEWAYISDNPA